MREENQSHQDQTSQPDSVAAGSENPFAEPIQEKADAEDSVSQPMDLASQRIQGHGPSLTEVGAFWFNLVVQPLIGVAGIVLLVVLFGFAQRYAGWFTTADQHDSAATAEVDDGTEYVCPMLCVPPTKEPGRCPVFGMELKARKASGDAKDVYGLTIDPASRRLSNIQTVAAINMPVNHEIEAMGRIGYDETRQSSITAYFDGRLERLFVDYTGARVEKGDQLALVYSPDLYAGQVELLQAKEALESSSSNIPRIVQGNQRLYESSRRRLMELGLPESQIDEIEKSKKADRRIKVYSPMSGTVVEKRVEEGNYVKTGMPLLKIADLSTVWLQLEMYPQDAANLQLGQTTSIRLQSHPGKTFEGKVGFVDPRVNPETQLVNVRVVVPNELGLIRIGDLARATVTTTPSDGQMPVIVPRESVLISGDASVAYVETESGRFEFRSVEVASVMGDEVAIASGIEAGEQVVAKAAFMVDAAFNMSGKPSLIDPTRAELKDEALASQNQAEELEIEKSFASLSADDRKLAESQVICPVTEVKLGTMGMGTPISVLVDGQQVMICCEGCRKGLLEEPKKYLAVLANYSQGVAPTADKPEPGGLPQMELPQMELPQMELPQMELPK